MGGDIPLHSLCAFMASCFSLSGATYRLLGEVIRWNVFLFTNGGGSKTEGRQTTVSHEHGEEVEWVVCSRKDGQSTACYQQGERD